MPVFSFLSNVVSSVFRPVLIMGKNIGFNISNNTAFLKSKKSIFLENESLRSELSIMNSKISNYNALEDENFKLKEILARKREGTNLILASVLTKPNQSIYDTIVIDQGGKDGIEEGDIVFAFGDIPIGKIAQVNNSSSKVILFSSPKEKTSVIINGIDAFVQMTGRGGGNFEMILPRDFNISSGVEAYLPGIYPYLVAIMETTISDPRDSFIKILLRSPVNIQELKFVQVEK